MTPSLHEAAADMVAEITTARPATPREGILAHLDRRKERLRAGLVSADDAECRKIDRMVKAVGIVADVFGQTFGEESRFEWPEMQGGARPWERRQRLAQYHLALADLLTPPGWRGTTGATLEALQRSEEQAILDSTGEERALHQAVLYELRLLRQTLADIERKGAAARRDVARRMGIPHV